MAENVVWRKADGEQVRSVSGAEILVNHQLLGEFEFVLVGEGGGADHFVEASIGSVFTLAMRGRAQNVAVSILPIPVPIFRGAISGVEILCPLRQVAAIVSGGDPRAAPRFDPISCVCRKSPGKHSCPVFQGNSKHSGLPLGSDFQLVT